jgi:flagellar biosynthesis/type III secretory pathway chaperone
VQLIGLKVALLLKLLFVDRLSKKIDTDQGSAVDKKAMEDLQDAHKSMMEWMQDLGDNFDSEEILDGKLLTPAKQELLDKEEEKVKIVKEKINSSIAKAKALLSE